MEEEALEAILNILSGATDYFDPTDLTALLTACDFITLSPEDLAQLQDLAGEEAAAALFASGTVTPSPEPVLIEEDGIEGLEEDLVPQKEGPSIARQVAGELVEEAAAALIPTGRKGPSGVCSSGELMEPMAEGKWVEIGVVAGVNLFAVGSKGEVSMTLCECGTCYGFLSEECPACGGNDPLGLLWKSHQDDILKSLNSGIVDDCCSAPMGIYSVLGEIQNGVHRVLSKTQDASKLKNKEGVLPHELAQALLDFFDPVFQMPFLGSYQTNRLKVAVVEESNLVTSTLQSAADEYRNQLGADAAGRGWVPSADFSQRLACELKDAWSPSIRYLGTELTKAYLAAAAAYVPVRKVWEKRSVEQSDVEFYGKIGRAAFKAVKTAGLSLAFDLGKFVFKSVKEEERYETFTSSLSTALEKCRRLESAIAQAKEKHKELLTRLGSNLTFYTIFSLGDYYGPLQPQQQRQLAERVAEFAGVSDWQQGSKDRGLKAAKKRRQKKILAVVGKVALGLIAVLGAAFAILYFGFPELLRIG